MVIFRNCAPFNTQIGNARDINNVMPMHNLVECSGNYSKTSGSLWQYYRDDPNDNTVQSKSFKSKTKITGKTRVDMKILLLCYIQLEKQSFQ